MKHIQSFTSFGIYEDIDTSTKRETFVKIEKDAQEPHSPKHQRRLDQLANIYHSLSGPSWGLKGELERYIRDNLGFPGAGIISRNLGIRFGKGRGVELLIKDSRGYPLMDIWINSKDYTFGKISDKDFMELSTRDSGFIHLLNKLVESIQKGDIYLEN
ncbi:hypothetical protein EBU71_02645 [bacterium]|nr:hypothetical protein [Candidatus Elulimicrobium humile]